MNSGDTVQLQGTCFLPGKAEKLTAAPPAPQGPLKTISGWNVSPEVMHILVQYPKHIKAQLFQSGLQGGGQNPACLTSSTQTLPTCQPSWGTLEIFYPHPHGAQHSYIEDNFRKVFVTCKTWDKQESIPPSLLYYPQGPPSVDVYGHC